MDITWAPVHDWSPRQLERLEGDEVLKVVRFAGGLVADDKAVLSLALGLLQHLGLAIYRHPAQMIYLVGLHEVGLHDHDRWFYISFDGMTWARIYNERINPHPSDIKQPLLNELADVEQRIAYLTHGLQRWPRDTPTPARLLLHSRVLATSNEDWLRTAELPGNIADLHDLICHTDMWREANPEAADLPRELLLRMHGLGRAIDTMPEGEGDL